MQPGLKRFHRALVVAHQLVDADGDPALVAKERAARLIGGFGTLPRELRKVRSREVMPALPLVHLALPFVARWKQPEVFQRRWPELAPWALPLSFGELLEDEHWPLVALDAAERWRQLLPFPAIEVRAERRP